MSLTSLTRICGKKNPAGTKGYIYVACECDLDTIPTVAAAAPDFSKVLDTGTFTFKASSPQGFAKIPIIMDTGSLDDLLVGEKPGAQSIESELKFEIAGNDAENLAFADKLIAYSGCLVAVVETKGNHKRLFGNKEIPAIVKAFTGSTGTVAGDLNGQIWALKWSGGETAPIVAESIAIPVLSE